MPVEQTTPSLLNNSDRFYRTSEKLWLPVWAEHGETTSTTVTNSAKQPYPQISYELVAIAVYHCTVFKASYDDSTYREQIDSLNSGSWRNWEAYECWVSEIHTEERNLNQQDGIDVHYVVRCIKRPGGWRFVHADIGWLYDDSGTYKSFMEEEGKPFIGKLDGSGGKLTMSSDMKLNFHTTKQEIDFSGLGF